MKNTKRKSMKKKALAITASLAILASNVSLTFPAKVTFAEDITTGETVQENTSGDQVSSPPLPNEEITTENNSGEQLVEGQGQEDTTNNPEVQEGIPEKSIESFETTQSSEETQESIETTQPSEETQESIETTQPPEETQESLETSPSSQETTPEPNTETVQEESVDYQLLPSLLITEIMPNNTGSDDYEYFEVYNNSDQPIVLDHFSFSLRYTDGSAPDVDMDFTPATLGPKETIVFWHNSNNKTVTDFNSHYQTNFTSEEIIQFGGVPNFYNSGNRGVVIKDPAGNDLVAAHYLLEDIASGQVVQYQFPTFGVEMNKLATKAQPTPDTLIPEQVPTKEVVTGENHAPVITHSAITEANAAEDLVIAAQITDDHDDISASVYYQTEPGTDFVKVKMEKGTSQTYEAMIPKNILTTNKLSYYIEVTDPNNTVSYSKNNPIEVAVKITEKIDFDKLPPLLITEISPNSSGGGTDYYEYFELYNNSDQPQVLSNYSFIYHYTDSGKELSFQIPATTIEPKETLLFWFNNGNKTLSDFNAEFGSTLTSNQVIPFTDTFPGFANGGNRALVLKDQQGAEVISASYLGTDNDNSGGVIQYKFPFTGTVMDKFQGLAAPTPGTSSDEQVPEVPVHLPETPVDTEAPVIDHTLVLESEAFIPIKIEAKVTDNLSVPLVTLHYKQKNEEHFTAISMNPSLEDANHYSAEIPAASITEDVTYFIEASDGVNVETTTENIVKVNKQEIDYNKIPHLLVTEVVPDSTNVGTADGYEFIEIYNNSNQEINFKDYKLYYRYGTDPGTDVVWPSIPEEVTIPAGETLTFWIINDQNSDKSVADFNAHYGANLIENKNIVTIHSGGMANGSMRGLVIGTNTHKEIALAYYNDEPNIDDSVANKGIMYSYPIDQSTQQIKLAIENATPGKVATNQVPKQPVQLPEDTIAPVIENRTSMTEILEKENIEILAHVTDDREIKSVRLFYKISGQTDYQMQILQKDAHDSLYHSIISSPEIIGKEEVEYYFVASDGTNEQTSEHYTISVTSDHDQSSLRLNVKEGEIVSGQVILKATSETDAPADVTLSVDGSVLENETYQSLERPAYFAFDVNGLNTYFQNAITRGEEVLYLMDDDWLTQWKTFSIPIEPDTLQLGDNVLTVRSGNKATPFDLESLENRDDYDLKNVRLVLSDGTVLTDPTYSNPTQVLKMNDANPFVDFHFTITGEHALSKTVTWDTALVPDGEHTVAAKDGDEEKAAKILVDNTAPVIESNLIEGKEYKGAFSIDAKVTDEMAGVKSVETFLDDETISLPYETASSKLSPGNHKLTVKGTDHAGNTSELILHFSVANENPEKPGVISPANGETVTGDPTLKVKVSDPTQDDVDVTFYQGYRYDASMPSSVKGFKNATDTEPPQSLAPAGEQAFTAEDQSLVTAVDGQYLTTDSDTQFPYHRFDVSVDDSVSVEDEVELYWKGKSLEGRKVSMYAWNHQLGDWALIDYNIAGLNDFELSGKVDVSEFLKDQKINVLIQDEIPSTPDEYDYTFVWMSDTQFYSESFPYIFDRQTQWIAEKQDEMKIKYVFHTGDLVNVSTDVNQWNYADQYMGVLDEHQIPYGVLAGNHDVNQINNDYSEYYKYFGADRFENKPYYGDSYLNNRGHYDLISAGGNDYIMVYLGWGVTDEGIAWVNDVLAAHPDRKAILNFHEYLLATGTRHPLGEKLYNEIVVPNENVIAVLSGHYHEAQTFIDEIDDNGDGAADRKVYQMLADYQAGPEGGQGYMRLLHFDQDNNRILVNTYSPYLDDYNYYDTDSNPGKDEFVIQLDLAAANKQVATDYFAVNVFSDSEIGKDQGVASGETAETVWRGLTEGKTYSWYAVVADAYTGKTTSDIWTFVKGPNSQTPVPDPTDEDQEGPPTKPGEQPSLPDDPTTQPVPDHSGGDQNVTPIPNSEQPPEKADSEEVTKETAKNKNSLPNTATNIFNILLAGTALLAAGIVSLLFSRRKRQQ